jgi:hypothetical protein
MYLILSSLLMQNFMTKLRLEDIQIQGRVRPPPSEMTFASRFCRWICERKFYR